MVSGLTFLPKINHINKIPGALEKATEKLNKQGPSPYTGENVPPAMRKTIKLGRRIWQIMAKFNMENSTALSADALIGEIANICINDNEIPPDNECESAYLYSESISDL